MTHTQTFRHTCKCGCSMVLTIPTLSHLMWPCPGCGKPTHAKLEPSSLVSDHTHKEGKPL